MSKTILLVDDSRSIREMASHTLQQAGYHVELAEDGQLGLAKLDGTKYHLIISDVNMPNMDGLTMVEELKKREAYQFTPVLMLTTESSAELKARGKAAGAKAWMVKPFQPDILLKTIKKLT